MRSHPGSSLRLSLIGLLALAGCSDSASQAPGGPAAGAGTAAAPASTDPSLLVGRWENTGKATCYLADGSTRDLSEEGSAFKGLLVYDSPSECSSESTFDVDGKECRMKAAFNVSYPAPGRIRTTLRAFEATEGCGFSEENFQEHENGFTVSGDELVYIESGVVYEIHEDESGNSTEKTCERAEYVYRRLR
jgi:hypothetical protein